MIKRFNNNPLALSNEKSSSWTQNDNRENLPSRTSSVKLTDSLRQRIKDLQRSDINRSTRSSVIDLPVRFLALPVSSGLMLGGGSDKENISEIVSRNVDKIMHGDDDDSVIAKTVDAFRSTKDSILVNLKNSGKKLSKETESKLDEMIDQLESREKQLLEVVAVMNQYVRIARSDPNQELGYDQIKEFVEAKWNKYNKVERSRNRILSVLSTVEDA